MFVDTTRCRFGVAADDLTRAAGLLSPIGLLLTPRLFARDAGWACDGLAEGILLGLPEDWFDKQLDARLH